MSMNIQFSFPLTPSLSAVQPVVRKTSFAASPVTPADSVHFSGKIHTMNDTPEISDFDPDTGMVKAGFVLKMLDKCAGAAAAQSLNRDAETDPVTGLKILKGKTVTSIFNSFKFEKPIPQWWDLKMSSRVTKAWTTSCEVETEIKAVRRQTGESRTIGKAYSTFVGKDEQGNKVPFPAHKADTGKELKLANEAQIRREQSLAEEKQSTFIPIQLSEEPTKLSRLMTDQDRNDQTDSKGNKRVFGGVILSFIDEVASQAARTQAKGPVAGLALDRMKFLKPVNVGETLIGLALVTNTGRTSMNVQVDVYASNTENANVKEFNPQDPKMVPPDNSDNGLWRRVATSNVTYVHLQNASQDPDNPQWKPAELKTPWQPGTKEQETRQTQAQKRYAQFKKDSRDGQK